VLLEVGGTNKFIVGFIELAECPSEVLRKNQRVL
jgi:hypothetical protein